MSKVSVNLQKSAIIVGEDNIRVDKILNEYRSLAGDRGYEIVKADADRNTESEINDFIVTSPIFTTNRLVIIRDVHKLNAEQIESIMEAIDKVRGINTVIITMKTISNRLREKTKKMGIEVFELKKLSFNETFRYIRENYKDIITVIGEEPINALINVYGRDISLIDAELRKISILLAEGKNDYKDVYKLLPQVFINRAVYNILDDTVDKKTNKKMRGLAMLEAGDTNVYQLIALFQNLYMNLMLLKISNVWDEKEASSIISTHPYIAKRYIMYSQRLTYEKIKNNIYSMIKVEFMLKSGRTSGFQGFYSVVYDL